MSHWPTPTIRDSIRRPAARLLAHHVVPPTPLHDIGLPRASTPWAGLRTPPSHRPRPSPAIRRDVPSRPPYPCRAPPTATTKGQNHCQVPPPAKRTTDLRIKLHEAARGDWTRSVSSVSSGRVSDRKVNTCRAPVRSRTRKRRAPSQVARQVREGIWPRVRTNAAAACYRYKLPIVKIYRSMTPSLRPLCSKTLDSALSGPGEGGPPIHPSSSFSRGLLREWRRKPPTLGTALRSARLVTVHSRREGHVGLRQ